MYLKGYPMEVHKVNRRKLFSLLAVAPLAIAQESTSNVGRWVWAMQVMWNLEGDRFTTIGIAVRGVVTDKSVLGLKFTLRVQDSPRYRNLILSGAGAVDKDGVVSLYFPLSNYDETRAVFDQYVNLDWALVEILRESGTVTKRYDYPTFYIYREL